MSDSDRRRVVKCLVWDLDDTLWTGTLLEPAQTVLRPEAMKTIEALDARGILHSIASRNDHDHAMARLTELGVADYFLFPQISWNSKVESLKQIAAQLNIGVDALAFIDDQEVERAEVAFSLPEVLCLPSEQAGSLADLDAFQPRYVTDESAHRRAMYRASIERDRAEQAFVGPTEAFLATLDMELSIRHATEADLQRAEELTVRTNQLNTTGYTYSYDQLDGFRRSPDSDLYVAALRDRFGDYGTVGLTLVVHEPAVWTIKLLLMSCRVMNRGIGTILINHVLQAAAAADVAVRAEFVANGRNRVMLITYIFAGFEQVHTIDGTTILQGDLSRIQPPPAYLTVHR